MWKGLVSILFACAIACSDAHSHAETQRDAGQDARVAAPVEDAQVALPMLPRVDPTAPTGCEHEGRRYKFGEQFFDRERCQSRTCGHGGTWDIQSALCSEGKECDGGPCDACPLGSQQFPLGETLVCTDGCNRCTCTAYGKWLSTTVACSPLEPVMPCPRAPDGDATRPLFLAGTDGQALALRSEFHHGGCVPASVKACYANEALPGEPPRVRIWLEAAQPLAACTIGFIAERVFSVVPLREKYAAEHVGIELLVGSESIELGF